MDFEIDRAPGFRIGRANHLLLVEIRNGLKQAGMSISPEALSILILLYDVGKPIRVSDLAELAVRDGTTLKRQIDGLLLLDYVSQNRDATDRRVVLISCTLIGRQAVEFIAPVLHAIKVKAFKGIDGQAIDTTNDVLEQVKHNLLNSK